ncbi:sperm flagellar protein 2 isoform X3 [Channa argus]|uniref:sperm flagellar protein 2 isoform X3 n=1 Tax=Channa argus TaxID=215402 RepID=UPI00352283D7
MSEILCRWLNQELRLSKTVEPKTFAKDFSSGYLFGEVLHKYELQNDFSMFMKKDTAISKLNNFTRLEPTLQLLGISFSINTAQELMQEKQGVATRLLYQLYVSLEKKKRSDISGTMMEMMQPAANAALHRKQYEIYSDRLHQVVKRDAELKLQKISQHYEKKFQQLSDRSSITYPIRQPKIQDEKRRRNIEKLQVSHLKYSGIMPLNQACIVKVPKPPYYTLQLNLKKRLQNQRRRQQAAQNVQTDIAQFEINKKKLVTTGFPSSSSCSVQPLPGDLPLVGSSQSFEVPGSVTKVILKSNSEYIQEIRQRLEENAIAREQREKRRNRFLVEQLKAHEAQEVKLFSLKNVDISDVDIIIKAHTDMSKEAQREEQLVKRLTRQTQQEKRLAVQLLQIRMQKEVIRENRLFRELQYQQRRERDIQEALEREATLAQQAKLDHAEEIRKELEFLNRIAAERSQLRYQKHFKICKDILGQLVDLATKAGEYRLLSENLIPQKLMREWKELLFRGLPLYEPTKGLQPTIEFSGPLDPVECEKQEILNNQDYDEYTNMVGEWAWPEEEGATKLPLTNNNILGHVVRRLRNIVQPPSIEPSAPLFPEFTLKASVLGKFCSGKTTCLTKFAEAHGLYVLSAHKLVKEVLDAYQNREEVPKQEAEKANDQLLTSLKPDLDTEVESRDRNITLSTQAMQGNAVEEVLKKGKIIPNELLLDIIIEAIRQVPAQAGWILDGFPEDITQAYLLEKGLGGSVDVENEVENSRANLAADPNPPRPPPPPAPVLDLVLLLDIPDDSVVRRAYSQTETDTTANSHTTDQSLYLAQIPHRINAFRDTWPKLEKWFGGKQNILVHADASVDEEELYKRVDSVLQQMLLKGQKDPFHSGKDEVSSSSAAQPLVDPPLSLTEEAADQTESNAILRPFRKASIHSLANEDFQAATKISPETACLPLGSSNWVYVDEPLPKEIPEFLCTFWETMCISYVNNVKTVMQQLRSQHAVVKHLFHIREGFKQYLGRPDLKQELVSQWQKDFNSKPDDMREDEDTKAELHLRLDELRERLWDISDKCKEENEKERDALMNDGWLEDHIAMLVNHHSTLIQVELDRFQKTLSFVKVYYSSMYRQVLPEPPSNIISIPLVNTQENKDQDERRTDSSQGLNKANQDQMDPVKQPHVKLISDYEDAIRVISELVSAGAHQGETNEYDASDEPNGKNPEVKSSQIKHIHQEYAAVVSHEVNAAKVRIAMVKGHGLILVNSLKSRAEQTLSNLQKWLETQYLAEMKSVDQLCEVVCHHIEAGSKLQYELVLESTDFYLNGDCHMVASPAPPPRPPPMERPTQSTLTIAQLESLYQQLRNIAPSGIMSSSEFFRFLRDILSVNTGRNSLPKTWMNKNETQLKEIVSLLMDHYQHIDWCQFLLSAALPWPFPSITELLVVLQCFKAADPNSTGYINEQQYLQTELWFSSESAQPSPEDPSEPLPYDRLANLHKFFFQLFADHFFSPPQLDYVSMLQYFAADPNPREGFIRALSVVLGQNLELSTAGQLVKSMPSIEAAAELSFSEIDMEYKKEEALCTSGSSSAEPEVSIPALFAVICHKATKRNLLPPGSLSEQHLVHIFKELGFKPEDCVPFSVISPHPFMQCIMESSTHYQLVNICPSE